MRSLLVGGQGKASTPPPPPPSASYETRRSLLHFPTSSLSSAAAGLLLPDNVELPRRHSLEPGPGGRLEPAL
ncbi:hypothetical protein U9M48_037977 [Paspalum notatum var. saurae]|uniref:Uncharacterized protein n=1 Tax=Paspalum notatum var. saurae TaxID=547442 RepID=A0AAQ3UG49_PASNO